MTQHEQLRIQLAVGMTRNRECALCAQPLRGMASINDLWYCHDGDSPTCYEQAQADLAWQGDGEHPWDSTRWLDKFATNQPRLETHLEG